MEYHLAIFGNAPTAPATTILQPPVIQLERWSKRINAPGKLAFSMQASHPEATAETLKLYRRVVLYRNGLRAWHGFIQETLESEGRIQVICSGMLDFFAKRLTANNETFNGAGATEALGLLSDCNSDSDTGVTAGIGTVVSTHSLTAQGRMEVLRAWEMLAQAHHAEFEIDDEGAFNFVPSLGSDKSGTLQLIYRRDGDTGTNLLAYQRGESGLAMANRIIGATTGGAGYTSTWNDASGTQNLTTGYGVLAEQKQFNEATTQATLDAMTQAYGEQRRNPPTDMRVSPMGLVKRYNPITDARDVSGLDYTDIAVGDLVTLTVATENENTNEAKRLAEIIVEVDDNLQERLSFTLSKSGVFITAAYLDASKVLELSSRIKTLEQNV